MTPIKFSLAASRSQLLVCLLCLLISAPGGDVICQSRDVESDAPRSTVKANDGTNNHHVSQDLGEPFAQCSSLPVIFIPGTAGSELRRNIADKKKAFSDELYWLGLSTLKNKGMGAAPLDKRGMDTNGNKVFAANVLTSFSVPVSKSLKRLMEANIGYAPSSYDVDVYANFLSWGQAVFGKCFYTVPYDWRKGAGQESSELIEQTVNQALDSTKQKQVILLAHSLGGLVSRDYIVRFGREKVAALIAVGTPWLGTPKAARGLLWGYNFDIGVVSDSGKRVNVKGLPDDFKTDVCANSKCQYLNRISFFKRDTLQELSKNFPGLYLQLPTRDFMEKYAGFYGQGFRSIIWGMNDWPEVEKFYRDKNATLYDAAQEWRKNNLNGQSYKVNHYLIGGVYSPRCKDKSTWDKSCKIENRTDMQMAQENQVKPPAFGVGKLLPFLDKFVSIAKYNVYEDPFVATDSDYEWGDGTSPLLSATAGEYIRGEKDLRYDGEAMKYLGDKTVVKTVALDSKYGHGAMLNDPKIKQMILDIYGAENGKLGISPALNDPGKEVTSITIEVSAEDNQIKNLLTTEFLGTSKTIFLNSTKAVLPYPDPQVRDAYLFIPKDRSETLNIPVNRNLRMTDLPGLSIKLARRIVLNEPAQDLVITGVKVSVNNDVYFVDENKFSLGTTGKTFQLVSPK